MSPENLHENNTNKNLKTYVNELLPITTHNNNNTINWNNLVRRSCTTVITNGDQLSNTQKRVTQNKTTTRFRQQHIGSIISGLESLNIVSHDNTRQTIIKQNEKPAITETTSNTKTINNKTNQCNKLLRISDINSTTKGNRNDKSNNHSINKVNVLNDNFKLNEQAKYITNNTKESIADDSSSNKSSRYKFIN
jgi:hypothetical protein